MKFPGPGNRTLRSWNLLGNDADTDAETCASAHLYSILYIWVLQPLFTVYLDTRVQLLCVVYAGTICSIGLFVSLFKHCWFMTGSSKIASFVLESPGIFCNQESGNPRNNNAVLR